MVSTCPFDTICDLQWLLCLFSPRALSMASKFPHVQFIGIDLAPAILNESTTPENCQFELGDINQGLSRFHGQIDLIHMRQVCGGVSPRRCMPIHQTPFWSIPQYYRCTFSTTL